MTPLARFTPDPEVMRPDPEFNVEEIISSVNLGPELDDEMRAMVREMLETRRRTFASMPKYVNGVKSALRAK